MGEEQSFAPMGEGKRARHRGGREMGRGWGCFQSVRTLEASDKYVPGVYQRGVPVD